MMLNSNYAFDVIVIESTTKKMNDKMRILEFNSNFIIMMKKILDLSFFGIDHSYCID